MSLRVIDPTTIRRVDVLGVGVSCIDLDDAVAFMDRAISTREPTYICITGVHGVMESRSDEALKAIHNAAGLVTPDGMPMVWSGRLAGASNIRRVYGPDLVRHTAAAAAPRGWRSYFYGGKEGVADLLAERLVTDYPGFAVAGTTCPPFRPLLDAEKHQLAEELNRARPDIIWVGLSTPKQERFMAEMRPLLECPVMVGVGAAFDIVTGLVPQAPRWMQRSGLEWAFRLGTEPRRLWRRYLVNNPRFVLALARNRPRLVDVGAG